MTPALCSLLRGFCGSLHRPFPSALTAAALGAPGGRACPAAPPQPRCSDPRAPTPSDPRHRPRTSRAAATSIAARRGPLRTPFHRAPPPRSPPGTGPLVHAAHPPPVPPASSLSPPAALPALPGAQRSDLPIPTGGTCSRGSRFHPIHAGAAPSRGPGQGRAGGRGRAGPGPVPQPPHAPHAARTRRRRPAPRATKAAPAGPAAILGPAGPGGTRGAPLGTAGDAQPRPPCSRGAAERCPPASARASRCAVATNFYFVCLFRVGFFCVLGFFDVFCLAGPRRKRPFLYRPLYGRIPEVP